MRHTEHNGGGQRVDIPCAERQDGAERQCWPGRQDCPSHRAWAGDQPSSFQFQGQGQGSGSLAHWNALAGLRQVALGYLGVGRHGHQPIDNLRNHIEDGGDQDTGGVANPV